MTKHEDLLVKLYADAPEAVAKLCDEELDRSGALLGRVREGAAAMLANKHTMTSMPE